MTEGLVTVVLPIYNVEKYLDRCIASVVNQTYKKLEIILVDDGSTDSCYQICEEWSKKDERIKVIHKENQGLGMARNTGIENANGEYICFFDSDDFIAPETVEKTYSKAKSEHADIVSFGVNFADENGEVIGKFISPLGYVNYSKDEVLGFFFPELIAPDPHGDGTKMFYMSTCFMLYSVALINTAKWRFISEREIISEDVYSLLALFKYVNKVSVIPEAYYFYCRNEKSLSRKYNPDRFYKVKHFYIEAKKLCLDLGYDMNIIHRVSKPYLSFVIPAMKQECRSDCSISEKIKKIREFVHDETLQTVLDENKYDNVSLSRKVLFFALRHKMSLFTYLLLKAKS